MAPSVGPPLYTAQRSLVGSVPGIQGGYRSLIVVTDAERSLSRNQDGPLITIAGVGSVTVGCTPVPSAGFKLTAFAAGEGPPVITHDSTPTHVGSLAGYTGYYQLAIPPAERTHETLQHWQVDGGGEAFQFTVDITALIAPTVHRCDLVANATTVTHGSFYRYAHAKPGG
jgi:hypothetical protein